MKLLLIGGTRFIGRTVVQKALKLGHDVAIFHRGQHETVFANEVLHIHGENINIADHLEGIKAYNPDAVIDTTQFETESTQAVVDALTGVVDRYLLSAAWTSTSRTEDSTELSITSTAAGRGAYGRG